MDTSYLSSQLGTIVKRLHSLYDEIGVASHERDSRDAELLSALSETMNNQLNLVTKEKHSLSEEAQHLINTIQQMERSLDEEVHHNELTLTYPLLDCLRTLKEKHQMVSRLHRERFEQVRKLVEALDSYASHLEPSFLKVKLPPTEPGAQLPPSFELGPKYVASLDKEFTRVYEEYNRRVTLVKQTADEIVSLWSELGTPQAQIDSSIVQYARETPEQLGLHAEDMRRLMARRDKLVNEKTAREKKLKDLRCAVEGLWNRLSIEEPERKQFLAANRGCGLRQINEFEDELSRLNELKKQNLHLFVEDTRVRLQELWDNLYFSEEEMLEFAPAFSDVYSDALLSAHEQEILRLETLRDQRAPILTVIDRHRSLIQDREDLEKSSQDASRLMMKGQRGEKRDPGKLLREEKQRKRIAKDLPKVEAELRKTLQSWEDEYGRPFCVRGERYLDELEPVVKAPARSKTPTRSKTPVNPPKSAGRAPASQPQSRAGTMRGPPRSKTPTMVRNPATTAPMLASKSPSKIPGASRIPMGSLRDGNNSPERRLGHKSNKSQPNLRVMRDDTTASPPKMKVLFTPQTQDNYSERSESVVRHVDMDDPYAKPRQRNYQDLHSSVMGPPPRPLYHRAPRDAYDEPRPVSQTDYPHAPPSRQLSNTSSIPSTASAISGSENWECYTDASEADEADAREAYYAKVRAQQMRAPKRASSGPTVSGSKRLATERDVHHGDEGHWSDVDEVF